MPCCLVFSIVILRFSAIRNLLSDSVSLFKFPPSKSYMHTRY